MVALNNLKPAIGSNKSKARKGRGIGSGLGKTCGRGHKGQKSRSRRGQKLSFEGGQMPLSRRLPKFGFSSYQSKFKQDLNLSVLNLIKDEEITLSLLKKLDLIKNNAKSVKIIATGEITRKVTLIGIQATKCAAEKIIAAGGSV